MAAFKNRKVDPKKRVQVYKNLHNGMFSVMQEGKVVFHCKRLILRECSYNVGQAGNKKVRETGQKNVHAKITGYLSNPRAMRRRCIEVVPDPDDCMLYGSVKYNPKTQTKFEVDGNPVDKSDWADLLIDGEETSVLAVWERPLGG